MSNRDPYSDYMIAVLPWRSRTVLSVDYSHSPAPTPTPGCTGTFRVIDSIFGRESAHEQCQLTTCCHVDRSGINSLNIFGGATTSL
jgi:hypothetical protein